MAGGWLLKGDTNTAYFEAIVEGRRQKCSIPCLWDGDVLLEQSGETVVHIYCNKELFMVKFRSGISLGELLSSRAQSICE